MFKLRVVPSLVFWVGIVGLLDKLYWVTDYASNFVARNRATNGYNYTYFPAFDSRAAFLNSLSFENAFMDLYFRFPLPQIVYFMMVLVASVLIYRDNRSLIAKMATARRAPQKHSPQATPKCRSCGAPLEPGTAFCGYCGNRIQ